MWTNRLLPPCHIGAAATEAALLSAVVSCRQMLLEATCGLSVGRSDGRSLGHGLGLAPGGLAVKSDPRTNTTVGHLN